MSALVTIVDHTRQALAEFDARMDIALKVIGDQAVSYAVLNITDATREKDSDGEKVDLTKKGEYDNSRVDTGQLRRSITAVVHNGAVYIGSNIPYAPYHEFGTGIYASNGQGRQSPWAYKHRKLNKWMYTKGLYPIHYLKNAAANHLDEYQKILTDIMSKNR